MAIGNIFVASTMTWKASRPRNRKRANAYPAGVPSASPKTIVNAATRRLLSTDGSTPRASRKNCIVSVEKLVGTRGLG